LNRFFASFPQPNITHGKYTRFIVARVFEEILRVPGHLFADDQHAKNDIPSVLTTYEEKNAGLPLLMVVSLGFNKTT